MKKYKCLYNHEMLINFTTQTPYQSYDDPVGKAQFEGYIEELTDTQVDVIMCCPTAWRLPIYYSEVNPVWTTWGLDVKSPLPEADWKYFDKVFERVRRYMISENYEDPLQITIDTARKIGRDVFFSYRMNDHHYTHFNGDQVPPTMDPLWRDNPQWRLPSMGGIRSAMDYMIDGVREWYSRILEELIDNYDVDGLELDFMRASDYFRPEDTEAGLTILTDFVSSIRSMLNEYSAIRNKALKLCVRVPWSVERCRNMGVDIVRWQDEGLVDMINVSSHFRTTAEVDIRGFRQAMPEAVLYGELHFSSGSAHSPAPGVGGTRKTTREIYETTAHSFLEQGASGISLFNFCYIRDHHFHEPRLRCYTIAEPQFNVLKNITNRKYLGNKPKHYNFCGGFGQLPVKFPSPEPFCFELYLAEESYDQYSKAILRLQFRESGVLPDAVDASLNDTKLKMIPGSGELFQPESNEGLAYPLEIFFFEVPISVLKHGVNNLKLSVSTLGEFFLSCLKRNELCGLELALYKN